MCKFNQGYNFGYFAVFYNSKIHLMVLLFDYPLQFDNIVTLAAKAEMNVSDRFNNIVHDVSIISQRWFNIHIANWDIWKTV